MHKVATKIKRCRVELLKWSRQVQGNAAKKIQECQKHLESLKELGSHRGTLLESKCKGTMAPRW